MKEIVITIGIVDVKRELNIVYFSPSRVEDSGKEMLIRAHLDRHTALPPLFTPANPSVGETELTKKKKKARHRMTKKCTQAHCNSFRAKESIRTKSRNIIC